MKSGQSHIIHHEAHERYGDLVRLGPNMVSVSNPEAMAIVYPMRPGFLKVRAHCRGCGLSRHFLSKEATDLSLNMEFDHTL